MLLAKGPAAGEDEVAVGDMRFRPAALRSMRDRLAAADSNGSGAAPNGASETPIVTWPNGVVYYTFASNVSALHQRAFLDAAAEWVAWAKLTFTLRASQANYITVNDGGTSLGGGNSSVGVKGGQQFLNIGSTSWNRGTLCHEIGHTLGFVHEHQRSDRDSYVAILTANSTENDASNTGGPDFIKLTDSVNKGAYDFESVMHYARNAFSKKPTPADPNLPDATSDTIEPLPAYVQYLNILGAEFDRTLSRLDRAAAAALYGAPLAAAPGVVVTNTKDSGPGSLRTSIYFALDRSVAVPGATNTITFNLPTTAAAGYSGGVCTIPLTYLLNAPADGTVIDATTQPVLAADVNTNDPNRPRIALNGAGALASEFIYASGLRLRAANCTVKGLAIGNFNQQGILIFGGAAAGNVIQGCRIGTNVAGTAAAANALAGIEIYQGAHNTTIGGTTAAMRNVVSGNLAQGIYIHDGGSSGNAVQGNYLGTNAAGTGAIPNGFSGIEIGVGAQNNTVGGTATGASNVISGNKFQGVIIRDAGTQGNTVQGNFIGTNLAGTAALGNAYSGVGVYAGAQSNVIGGSGFSAGNVLSGNGNWGVSIGGSGTMLNTVAGNNIGLDANGAGALANAFDGVTIESGAQSNLLGGTAPGARNFISGNAGSGVIIWNASTSANRVQGNTIGLNAAGAAVTNGKVGVAIFDAAQGNLIGGPVMGAGNLISGNTTLNNAGGIGVYNYDNPATALNNTLSENSVFSNGGGSGEIVLYNGANGALPAPVLSSAVLGVNTVVGGTLSGAAAGAAYRLEFFATPAGGTGGKFFLGSASVTADPAGAASFTGAQALTLAPKVPAGSLLVATATSPAGSTSAFSAARAVTATDTDGDGLPNVYETANGLSTTVADANLDTDGDGVTNLQEFRAGTDPRNAASRLQISTLTRSGNDLSLSFASASNLVYRLETTADLSAGSWRLATDAILGTGGIVQIPLTGAATEPKRFYRIVTEP